MSFDISKLTSAVNKYLNSISEISNAAGKASSEIADRAQFSADLKEAIAQNMQSRFRDQEPMPDIAQEVQSAIKTATGGIDTTIEQINGGFEAIREAGKKSSEVAAIDTGSSASSDSSSSGSSRSLNADAFKGFLSTEALQDLSKSRYFSANLLQNALLDSDEKKEDEESSTISGMNTKSLLANSLNSDDTVKSALESASGSDATDLAKALIKAYAGSGSSLTGTSIFGDFSL